MIDETIREQQFDARLRALEDEVHGEKAVTRHILQETRQNSGELATIRAQIMHMAGDVVLANAALNSHGTRLNVLTQDVALMRTSLNRVEQRLDGLEQTVGSMREDVAAIRAAVAPREPQ